MKKKRYSQTEEVKASVKEKDRQRKTKRKEAKVIGLKENEIKEHKPTKTNGSAMKMMRRNY